MLSEKTRRDLGWDTLRAELAARARTRRGQAMARELPLLHDPAAARARHEEVGEARALLDEGSPLPLDGVREIDEALARAGRSGAVDADLLRDVASTLRAGAAVRRTLVRRGERAPRLLGRAALIAELDDIAGALEDAFEPGREARLSDRASPALGPLRRRVLEVQGELERRVNGLLDASHVQPHLQDRYATQRENRYVIPVRIDARQKVRGIVHGLSQSGQTVFVEPEEVIELNNRLRLAELEVSEEERRILTELSRLVEDELPRIRANVEVLTFLDLVDACARLSTDLKATPPELPERREATHPIDLRRARHPLLVLHRKPEEGPVVPSDLRLGFGQCLVVSGPNAGGKTVALKTAGLCVLMARAGLHVPAQEGSRLPWFDVVLSDVGDDQSLERNLSTFSAHVLHLREFLAEARPGALVLLDEVAVGTDPEQGAALAQALLEEVVARGATVIVTTHYDRLKALAGRDARFANASVGFDVERLQPTYQLHLGIPGASGAVVVARRLGLDEGVCARAGALSRERQVGLDELLLQVEAERRRLEAEREAVAREGEAAQAAREEAERLEALARERALAARKALHDEAVETLREARQELDRTRAVLRRSQGKVSPAEVDAARREIDRAAAQVHAAAPAPEAPPGRPATPEELRPGVDVWVSRLGGRGQVAAPPKGAKVTVQAGPLKATVPLVEVRLLEGAGVPLSARARRGHNAFDEAPPAPGPIRGRWPSLDLRGERVDAALARAEKFLDDALRAGQDGLLIIHGHGTGALRDRLREELKLFPGVVELRPGAPDEGGDGVTVIALG